MTEQNINKDVEELNHTIRQQDLIEICGILTKAENTFFPCAHRTYTKIDYIQGNNTNHNKQKN